MRRRDAIFGIVSAPIAVRALLGESPLRSFPMPLSMSGGPLTTFQNGFLPVIDSDLTVQVVDATGNVVGSTRVTVPGAAVSRVYAAAVSRDRVIIAGAAAKDPEGRIASLLVFSDFKGNIIRVTRTTPFAASKFIYLHDGTLLCLGREHDDQFEEVPGHKILRFYSSDGKLTSQALNVDLLVPQGRRLHPLNWDLVPGPDRIGLLDRVNLRYVEVDYKGAIVRPLGSLGIEAPTRVTGIALLSNGDRLVSTDQAGHSPLGLYRLKDSSNGQVTKTSADEFKVPDGSKGLMVIGVWQTDVVFLTMPIDRIVFAPQAV